MFISFAAALAGLGQAAAVGTGLAIRLPVAKTLADMQALVIAPGFYRPGWPRRPRAARAVSRPLRSAPPSSARRWSRASSSPGVYRA